LANAGIPNAPAGGTFERERGVDPDAAISTLRHLGGVGVFILAKINSLKRKAAKLGFQIIQTSAALEAGVSGEKCPRILQNVMRVAGESSV